MMMMMMGMRKAAAAGGDWRCGGGDRDKRSRPFHALCLALSLSHLQFSDSEPAKRTHSFIPLCYSFEHIGTSSAKV